MTDNPQSSMIKSASVISYGDRTDLQEGVDFFVTSQGITFAPHITLKGPDKETGYEGDRAHVLYTTYFGGGE